MRYPLEKASSIPGSGYALYLHLMNNTHISAKLSHDIWYNGCEKLRQDATHPFQGFFPVRATLKLSYAGSPMQDYTFTGKEKNPVYVGELSQEAKDMLGISPQAADTDKVYNPSFIPYENLSEKTKKDNELPALSLAKSISSYLSADDALFTESSTVTMLLAAIGNANSREMRHILHGNHVAWCASRFIQSSIMEEDIKKNFYGQNDIEFFIKDIGTVIPPMLYCLAILGVNPSLAIENLDYDLYGVKVAAKEMSRYMFGRS